MIFARAARPLRQVIVEAMVAEPRCEVIVGVAFDRCFGHALLFGRGGGDVERMGDITLTLLLYEGAVAGTREEDGHRTVDVELFCTRRNGAPVTIGWATFAVPH